MSLACLSASIGMQGSWARRHTLRPTLPALCTIASELWQPSLAARRISAYPPSASSAGAGPAGLLGNTVGPLLTTGGATAAAAGSTGGAGTLATGGSTVGGSTAAAGMLLAAVDAFLALLLPAAAAAAGLLPVETEEGSGSHSSSCVPSRGLSRSLRVLLLSSSSCPTLMTAASATLLR